MSKTANNCAREQAGCAGATTQSASRRGGGRGLELRSEAAWAYEVAHANTAVVSVNQAIRTMRMRQRTGPHPQQWSSPIDFLLLRDYAGRGGIRNRRMFQRHCSQYAGAGANAALSLPSIRFSTRSRHASFTSIFPKFSPLKSLRKAVGAFSMPCSTLSFHTSLPSRIHPDRS